VFAVKPGWSKLLWHLLHRAWWKQTLVIIYNFLHHKLQWRRDRAETSSAECYKWKKQKRRCYISWRSCFFRHAVSCRVSLTSLQCVALLFTLYPLPGSKFKPPPRHINSSCVYVRGNFATPLLRPYLSHASYKPPRDVSCLPCLVFPSSHILNMLTSFISFLCKCHFILKSLSVSSSFFFVVLNSMAMKTDLDYFEKWLM